jgi:hypothetical protein
MSITEYARQVGKPIGSMGGAVMMHPETGQFGDKVGLNFFEFYVLGRGGALGDVEGKAVADAFAFFEPATLSGVWDAAKQKMAPSQCVEHYTQACAEFGRARLADVDGLDDFCKLAERVAQAAEPTPSSALFAAWRDVSLPDDPAGRAAAQITLVLRELRGGAHVEATRQAGLSPLEAVAVNTPHMAQLFGWKDELPDVGPLRERAENAEAITDDLVAPAFESLDEGERERFAAVLSKIASAAGI